MNVAIRLRDATPSVPICVLGPSEGHYFAGGAAGRSELKMSTTSSRRHDSHIYLQREAGSPAANFGKPCHCGLGQRQPEAWHTPQPEAWHTPQATHTGAAE